MLYALFGLLAVILLIVDQWSKFWITANLPLGESMPFLPGFVELLTVHNYGAAWSSFSGQRWFLIILTLIIIRNACHQIQRQMQRLFKKPPHASQADLSVHLEITPIFSCAQ